MLMPDETCQCEIGYTAAPAVAGIANTYECVLDPATKDAKIARVWTPCSTSCTKCATTISNCTAYVKCPCVTCQEDLMPMPDMTSKCEMGSGKGSSVKQTIEGKPLAKFIRTSPASNLVPLTQPSTLAADVLQPIPLAQNAQRRSKLYRIRETSMGHVSRRPHAHA